MFAVDAGLTAIGRSWTDAGGETREGLGLVGIDTRTTRAAARTVVTRPVAALGLPAMVGWTSGTASLARDPGVAPLAEFEESGSRAGAGGDGVLADGVIATRLHGPVLALNPELADLVLARALGDRGWVPLPIPRADAARSQRISEVARAARTVRRSRRPWR